MTKWTYHLKQISLDTTDSGDTLRSWNGLGDIGWEAVAWRPDPQDTGSGLGALEDGDRV
jgi:hypothetical protein